MSNQSEIARTTDEYAELRERAENALHRVKVAQDYDVHTYLERDCGIIIRDLLSALTATEQRLREAAEYGSQLPDEWCEKCFYSLLRFNRKNGVECHECYEEPEDSLDDDDFEPLANLIRWAQALSAQQSATREGE